MTKKRRRVAIKALLISALLIAIGFGINWFMTFRLEDTLNKRLREEVSKATNGFYDCNFENLSIGLFSGELSIKGLELVPDSATFTAWRNIDSLPANYYKIHIGEIHFKGVNLTWRRSYRYLNFSLFEVRSPNIEIFESDSVYTTDKKDSSEITKSIYQTISPYIKELTVNSIRLKDANIRYTVEDSVSPIIYSLTKARFEAYNFRLDEKSEISGHLLYCDGFEFEAGESQQLLHSDQIILETDKIKLSTFESLIKIEGVKIFPSEKFWEGRTSKTGGYLKADVESVIVEGVKFKRQNLQNFLDADNFSVSGTDIQYYSVKGTSPKQNNQENISDTDQTWSLYSILSPILHSISIGKIDIEKTRFNYTLTQKGYSDTYTISRFDFHADHFIVDSLSEKKKKFWYVDNFTLNGSEIYGLMASNNSNIKVGNLKLSTVDKHFSISDIKVKPLFTDSARNYFSGGIKLIDVSGLDYTTGVSAKDINLDSVDIKFTKVSPSSTAKYTSPKQFGNMEDILNFFLPYADFLSVNSINLSRGKIVINDLIDKDIYQVQKLNFYATKFLLDENTRRNSRYYFNCDDIGLSFSDFDNLLPEKQYRLQIKEADISTQTGKLKLEGVNVIPQKETWATIPNTYYEISSPRITVDGFDNDKYMDDKQIHIRSFILNSPKIEITKTGNNRKETNNNSDKILDDLVKSIVADSILIHKGQLIYKDQLDHKMLTVGLDQFETRGLDWIINNKFDIEKLTLKSPIVNTISQKDVEKPKGGEGDGLLGLLGDNIRVKELLVSDAAYENKQVSQSINFQTRLIGLSGLSWFKPNIFDISTLNITSPYLDLSKKGEAKAPGNRDSINVYNLLSPYFRQGRVQNFKITDANINYSHTFDGKSAKQQKVNSTNIDFTGLTVDTKNKEFDIIDLNFSTKDFSFPVMDGFYTIGIGYINISKQQGKAQLSGIRMIPAYSKTEFAYRHPKHKDWFDVGVGDVSLSGIDYPLLFSDNVLKANNLSINNVLLQNFKNQQIEIQHNIMPLIYEKLQKAPLKFDIATANVSDFSVVYEELPKKGQTPGKIYFKGMNGKFDRLTNIAANPYQYMKLDVDGSFMGHGAFTAQWNIPVSSDYDCFSLKVHLPEFDLQNLNEIFLPLAKAEVRSGMLTDLQFETEASSTDARAGMLFLYNDLSVAILKNSETEKPDKFLTNLANTILKKNNPDKEKSNPRESYIYIDRDPYHSTFNYFWQILQPAIVESVGVSQSKQNFIKKASGFLTKVKAFFTGKGKDEKKSEDTAE